VSAKKLLESKTFLSASKESIAAFLKDDRFGAPEAQIFEAVLKWAKQKCSSEKPDELKKFLEKDILPLIRFPLMTSAEIATKVIPSGLLEMQQTLDLFAYVGAVSALGKSETKTVSLGSSIKHFVTTKRKPTGTFKWISSPVLTISEDGSTATQNGTEGACFGNIAFVSGKHTWNILVVKCSGNCLDIGVAVKGVSASLRVTGLHAGGTSYQIQEGCGRRATSAASSWPRYEDNVLVTLTLDMDARILGYTIAGSRFPVVYEGLPAKVWPACDLRQSGLSVRIQPEMELDWSGIVVEE